MAENPHVRLLNIEFNSSCNLRCRWCALDHSRPRVTMPPDTLELVMESLANGALPGLRRIDLHNGGETLLHPDLPVMLSVIRRRKARLPGNPVVGLLTNAMPLTSKKAEQIVRSRAVDQMRFSLDGGSRAAYESLRRGARWEVARENIEQFLRINEKAGRPMSTEAICIIPPEGLPPGGMEPEFAALLSGLDKVSLRHPHNWDGSADLSVDDASYRSIAAQRPGEVCFLLERNLVVLPDGRVTVCCNDLNGRGVIGSVLDSGLESLAAHPRRLAMLEAFRAGRKATIPLCRDCTGFYAPPGREET